MNRNYSIGEKIKFKDGNFEVVGIAGEGANSTVYYARNESDNVLHILKEFNPKNITLTRSKNGEFNLSVLSKNNLHKFETGKQNFINSAEKQKIIRNNFSDMMNNTFIVNGILEENNTAYIDMSVFEGQSYDKLEKENSLQELLIRIRAIAVAVKAYHDNGYLHLDIKPANIFVLGNSNDFVMLFDFDSVVEKMQIANIEVSLSYSANWAAPEQCNYRYRSLLSEKSDIFSMGEILFYRLFSRHSFALDRRIFSKYDFSICEYTEFRNTKVKNKMVEILRKTICSNSNQRFSSCDEFISELNSLIGMTSPKEQYISSTNVFSIGEFKGRKQELYEIERRIRLNPVLCITGMGGIGKSELARKFVSDNKEQFENILFFSYLESWKKVVNVDVASCIVNYEIDKSIDDETLFKDVIKIFGNLVNESTLIVVDNVDERGILSEEESIYRNSLLSLPGKFIITTRIKNSSYPSIDIGPLNNAELESLFVELGNLQDDFFDIEYIDKIIDYYNGHTLAIGLIAKQIYNEFSTPKDKYIQLTENGLNNSNVYVSASKDKVEKIKTPFEHIKELFSIANLSDSQLHFLSVMSLMPVQGIDGQVLFKLDHTLKKNDLLNLTTLGWLERINNNVKEHPLIQEVVCELVGSNNDYCELLHNFKENRYKVMTENILLSMFYIDSILSNLRKMSIKKEYIADFLVPDGDRIEFSLETALVEAQEAIEIYDNLNSSVEKIISAKCQYAAILSEMGEMDKAIKILEELTNIFPLTDELESEYLCGIVYNALGLSYFLFGDTDNAGACFVKAISCLRKTDNRGYCDLDQVYNNLGVYYIEIDESEKALEAFLNALKYWEKSDGQEEDKAFDLENIATAYYQLNDLEKANEYADLSLEIRKRIWGEESKPYASILMKKARYLAEESKEIEQVLEMLEKVENIYISYFGGYTFDTARMFSYIADTYKKCNAPDASIAAYNKANIIYRNLDGNQNKSILSNLIQIAKIYSSLGDRDSFLSLESSIYEIHKEIDDLNWINKKMNNFIECKKEKGW